MLLRPAPYLRTEILVNVATHNYAPLEGTRVWILKLTQQMNAAEMLFYCLLPPQGGGG
jgi:hypothetical protein